MNQVSKKISASIVAISLLAGSCSPALATPNQNSSQSAFSATATKSDYVNGKNLFKAVYFGVGEQASTVESVLNDPSYTKFVESGKTNANQTKVAQAYVEAIEEADPAFFQNYWKDMTSGDVFIVENSMKNSQRLVDDISQKFLAETSSQGPLANHSSSSISSGGKAAVPQAAAPIFIWAGAVWDAAAAVNYGVVVNVAGAVNAYAVVYAKTKFWPKSTNPNGSLQNEENIAKYTQALSEINN